MAVSTSQKRVTDESAMKLISYAAQIDFGDFDVIFYFSS
jgi:hypothetical protein